MDQAALNARAKEGRVAGKTPEAIAKALHTGDNTELVAWALYSDEGGRP